MDLSKAFLDDRPVWYRLEDPRQMRLGGKSPYVSPRGSLATEIANRLMRRTEFACHRSFSGRLQILKARALNHDFQMIVKAKELQNLISFIRITHTLRARGEAPPNQKGIWSRMLFTNWAMTTPGHCLVPEEAR